VRRAGAAAVALALLASSAHAEEPPTYESVVTATTPLHGSGLPRDRVPAHVQTATAAGLAERRSLDLSAYLNESMAGVGVNQVQENPLQPDLQYRGFLASPLLGAPQGLAVYVNGVRSNEAFGDVVNWDLLPTNAVRSINLMPGSNPLFGLNALGGALSVETETGFSRPGAAAHVQGGSFGRVGASVEAGGARDRLAYFVAANALSESGWRHFSPTRALQAFAAGSYRDDATTLDLDVAAAGTNLAGNGPSPVALLRADRAAVFTYPDRTENRLFLIDARGEQRFSPALRAQGLAYYRQSRAESANGDQARWFHCQDQLGTGHLCTHDEQGRDVLLVDGSGAPVAWNDLHPWDAARNETTTVQHAVGAAAQVAYEARLRGRENHLFAGATFDQGWADFSAQRLLARLSGTREAVATDVVDPTSPVGVQSRVSALGLYASDTFALLPTLFLTVSGRFNLVGLALEDQIGDELSGKHRFARLNPAAGISFQPTPALGGYVGYSESARAPTPLELTCADPQAPCRLPNAFASDPPLRQVVARTVEAGGRGRMDRAALMLDYALSIFRATNDDDIQFISAGVSTGQGYFTNVGRTRRQGLEASVTARHALGAGRGRLDWSLQYLYLQATFEAPFTEPSDHHPLAEAGALAVPAGSMLPGVPRHMARLGLGWTRGRFGAGAGLVANGGQPLRGDEANLLPPLPGYALVDLRASMRLTRAFTVFAKASNVLGARYSTFGVLGDAATVLGSDYSSPRFQSPGPPRAAWAGADWVF